MIPSKLVKQKPQSTYPQKKLWLAVYKMFPNIFTSFKVDKKRYYLKLSTNLTQFPIRLKLLLHKYLLSRKEKYTQIHIP